MEIKNDLLIRILKKLADYSDWSEAPKTFNGLNIQGKEKSLLAHVNHLIQMDCIKERKNQWVIREWRITPSGREYLKELLTPEVGF